MVAADPDLRSVVKVARFAAASDEARPILTGIYRVLSADAALPQGLNPSLVIFDEVHVQPGEDLWDAMPLGSGTRRQ